MTPVPLGFAGAFSSWLSMMRRCLNPADRAYPNYGGRGVSVCERWLDYRNFLSDMGPRPLGHSLNRIDNDGDYRPSNCQWADDATQMRNTRRNRYATINGVRMTHAEIARQVGVSQATIMRRADAGKPLTTKRGIKLTEPQVAELRQCAAYGLHDLELASAFGISRQAVGNIRRGAAWKPELIEDFDQ